MAKPVVVVASGGKPVVNVTGATPATPVDTLGQPITLVDDLGLPMTLINADGSAWASTWTPSWVDNVATGYLTFDGGAVGTDSDQLEIVFLLKALDGNGAAIQRLLNNNGPRIDIRLESNGRLRFIVKNTTGTDIIDWTASASTKGAGTWLIHLLANTTATPSFVASRAELTDNIPGAWAEIAGTFTTAATQGTMDIGRGAAGVDWAVFATGLGANILDNHCGYVWAGIGTPMGTAAFADAGVLYDPATVGAPFFLIKGPAASITDDVGSSNITLTATGGPFVDV
jgi:hypothetical protein